ncbi:MAG TPA: ABC transporter substrate-binding protein [Acidimicrobiales bacterium]|nr:ABC transporter substrate-binding protein [Acidimicrobiales bacterium]
MTERRLRRIVALAASSMALAISATALSGTSAGAASGGATAPGVTSKSITVGSLATLSGPLSSGFGDIVYGARAYFDMINAKGGVNGRKINLAYVVDDTGSATVDQDEARNLVAQDHVFAIVGVGSPFFTANTYLCQTGTPTFGYVVVDNWSKCPNLFGAYGSTLTYNTGEMTVGFLAKQLGVKSAAVVAYSIAPSSKDACAAYAAGLTHYGVHVGFVDLNLGYAADPTPDVQAMVSAHTDFLMTCTDGPENLKFVEALHQYGLGSAHVLWLTGYDRTVIAQNASVMTGSIFSLQHVPFEAAKFFPGKYPAMQQYLATMKKYEPQWTYDDTSIQGYINAAQFVAGLRAVGPNLTQKKLVAAINAEKSYNAGGLMPPIDPNWKVAHSSATGPFCNSYVQVMAGGVLAPAEVQGGDQTLVCFKQGSDTPLPLPPHTPPSS